MRSRGRSPWLSHDRRPSPLVSSEGHSTTLATSGYRDDGCPLAVRAHRHPSSSCDRRPLQPTCVRTRVRSYAPLRLTCHTVHAMAAPRLSASSLSSPALAKPGPHRPHRAYAARDRRNEHVATSRCAPEHDVSNGERDKVHAVVCDGLLQVHFRERAREHHHAASAEQLHNALLPPSQSPRPQSGIRTSSPPPRAAPTSFLSRTLLTSPMVCVKPLELLQLSLLALSERVLGESHEQCTPAREIE